MTSTSHQRSSDADTERHSSRAAIVRQAASSCVSRAVEQANIMAAMAEVDDDGF